MNHFFKFLLGLTLPLSAGAISKVGNSRVGDINLGFVATTPDAFPNVASLEKESLRLLSTRLFLDPSRLGFRNLQIQLRPFAVGFPDYSENSRHEIEEKLAGSGAGWKEFPLRDSCILALGLEAEPGKPVQLNQMLLAWGKAKGMVILGDNAAEVWAAIGDLARSLELDRGACAW